MNLHGQIMNLPCGELDFSGLERNYINAHKLGHRDARHAAAELAQKADTDAEAARKVIAELTEVAQNAIGAYESLRLVGADRHLPGFAGCEKRLKDVLARVG